MFPDIDGPTHRYMESSPGCWAAYGEVLAREYSNPPLMGVHRISVDTYAIQHPGKPSRQTIQSVNCHLLRLLLMVDRGLPQDKANDVMSKFIHAEGLMWLDPPASVGALTVASVLPCVEMEAHKAAVHAWARSALDAWSLHIPTVERLAHEVP
jgi:hypothetical protein